MKIKNKLMPAAICGVLLLMPVENIFADGSCVGKEFGTGPNGTYSANTCPGGYCENVQPENSDDNNNCLDCYDSSDNLQACNSNTSSGNVKCDVYRAPCNGSQCGTFTVYKTGQQYPCDQASGSSCQGSGNPGGGN